MATLTQKIEAEKRMRELLEEGGLPQPDRVEYGFTCVQFFFETTKHVVIVDIDEPGDAATAGGPHSVREPDRVVPSGGRLSVRFYKNGLARVHLHA